MKPDTVVFDIGNVLLDWNPRYLYRTIFADTAEMEWFLSEVCAPAWNLAQDAGRPWAEAEIEAIARHPRYAEQIRAFRARWSETVTDAIHGTVEILADLQAANVPLYAVTNFASDTFVEACARFPFLNTFRGTIVSGDEKLIKPDARIYRLLESRFDLDLTRCVFIDDSLNNVAGAKAVGMHALHFQSPAQFRRDLEALGFLNPVT
jgi:2-haloacid dehalogenase